MVINGSQRTSITAVSGSIINFSVYKGGYHTITGSTTLTDDTTINIELPANIIEKFAWTNQTAGTVYTNSVVPIVNDKVYDNDNEEIGNITSLTIQNGLITAIDVENVIYTRNSEDDK